MGRRYPHPPLIEAVCEFRLAQDSSWDLTIPGLVYEKIKDEFPHREQRLMQDMEISRTQEGLQQQVRTSERVLFFTKDRGMFVQLGPRLLAINCLKPYPTWAGFKQNIGKAFKALTDIVEVKGLQRIGLRYINLIEMPSSLVRLEDYFEFYLFLGPRLSQNMAHSIAGCEFQYAIDRDRCRVQLTPAPSASSGHPTLNLDIDYFLAKPRGVEVESAIDWVEESHNRVEEVFEGCITDRLRELFQEVKENASGESAG
ncbi:MAG TPA: TIGR04255 family protein [Candidatus Fraserbacteria bacterium]|nr:TIGR04255 family protein [Candidatus Fraserbacteria bacterium]